MMRLVLLPGMHGTGELFSDFIRWMPEPEHIDAFHYPSDASPSYRQLLAAIGSFVPSSEPYFLLAESFSTPLAIQFAATNPPNLKGLILCAGFAASPIRGWRKSIAVLLAPMAFRLAPPRFVMSRYLLGKNAPESLYEAVSAAIRSVKPAVLTARLRQILAVDARADLHQVSCPILFIKAQQDHLIGASSFAEVCSIKPTIKVARIEGPHLILQREPERSAMAVAEFICGIP